MLEFSKQSYQQKELVNWPTDRKGWTKQDEDEGTCNVHCEESKHISSTYEGKSLINKNTMSPRKNLSTSQREDYFLLTDGLLVKDNLS